MSKPLVQIAFNPVVAKIVGGDDAARDILANLMSYFVDGYEHTNAFQSHRWDGRSCMFNYRTDTFPSGFADIAIQELRDKGYEVQRVCRPLPPPLGPERPIIDAFGYTDRYDYQPETVDRLVRNGVMVARVATGGGKSRIARMAFGRLQRVTMFITTRKALMYQMKRGYEASGWKCGALGDGLWEPEEMLNVAMVKTLALRLKEPDAWDDSAEAQRQRRIRQKTLDLLAKVECVVGEEAHEAASDEYTLVLRAMRNAHYRLALTATPFMKDDAEANMKLMASFGQIGIDITEKMLIERGILARPYFKFRRQAGAPLRLRKTTAWARAYELGITLNAQRNADVVEDCITAAEYGLTSMVLVQRQNHGKELLRLIQEAGLRVKFIYGESNQKKRDAALEELGRGELDVLIGSNILDVGVDVPGVGMVILAGGGKAEVQTRQRIGRGLREKKNGLPNCAFMVDWHDEHNKHLRSHSVSRQDMIKSTPGFAENIIKDGTEFPFEALGFRKVRHIRRAEAA